MSNRFFLGTLIVTCLAAAAIGTTAMSTPQPAAQLPIADTALQAEFEGEVASFLESNPQPEPAQFSSDVSGQNAYWRAMVGWWNEVPWQAVAGQWGCVSSAVSSTFNPADENGVITAGRGGSGSCGGIKISAPPRSLVFQLHAPA